MTKRTSITVLALAVIAIIASLQFIRTGDGPPSDEQSRAHAAASLTAGADSMSMRPAPAGRPLLALPVVLDEARHRADNPRDTWSAGRDEGSLDGALQRAQENNAALGRFHTLRGKALRTSEEQQRYLDMLSDPAMLAAARGNLLAALHGGETTQEAELERVMQIRYLSSALTWEGNPQREQVLTAMIELVLAELPAGLPPEIRGSLLGDKMELFQYLVMNNPALADELMARVSGTRLEPVLLAARRMIEPASPGAPSNQQL
jgi:hypothetical protein